MYEGKVFATINEMIVLSKNKRRTYGAIHYKSKGEWNVIIMFIRSLINVLILIVFLPVSFCFVSRLSLLYRSPD